MIHSRSKAPFLCWRFKVSETCYEENKEDISTNGLSFYVRLEDFSPFSSFVSRIAIAHIEAIMLPPPVHQTLNGRLVPLQAAILQYMSRFSMRGRCCSRRSNLFSASARAKITTASYSLCSVCFPLFHEALCFVASLFRLKLLSWGAAQIPTDPAWT